MNIFLIQLIQQLKNGSLNHISRVFVKRTQFNLSFLRLLLKLGYIENYQWSGEAEKIIVFLKYKNNNMPVLKNIKNLSNSTFFKSISYKELIEVKKKIPFGFIILSTNKGLLFDYEALKTQIGGKLICWLI